MPDESRAGWPGRVAVAIVRSDPPQVFLADAYPDEDVSSESQLDAETASLEIRLERIFEARADGV